MRILAVAPYVPYEGILHAGGSYLLHHLEEMTRLGNQVTLVVTGTRAQLGNVRLAPQWLDVVMACRCLRSFHLHATSPLPLAARRPYWRTNNSAAVVAIGNSLAQSPPGHL